MTVDELIAELQKCPKGTEAKVLIWTSARAYEIEIDSIYSDAAKTNIIVEAHYIIVEPPPHL